MIFSRACEYGIRAVLYLSSTPEGTPVQVRDVASGLDIPFPFLAKVVQTLTRRGILRSQKGPGGGIRVARSPDTIRVLEIVDAIDGLGFSEVCVLGMPNCSDASPCPFHDEWGRVRAEIMQMLEGKSVSQLVEEFEKKQFVLNRQVTRGTA